MIIKGCWYFLVLSFFSAVAVFILGNAAGWVIGLVVVSFIGAIIYQIYAAPKAEAAALAMQQLRVSRKFTDVLPIELADEAKSAPRLVPEGSVDGWVIDTDGYPQVPRGDQALELTLLCQSAANAGTNTVLVAMGQLVIGKVKSEHLEELYQAVMAAGGVARCMGSISEDTPLGDGSSRETHSANSKVQIDVAKPFGLIKGQ